MASNKKRNKTLVLEAFNTLRRPRDIGRRTTSSTAPTSGSRRSLQPHQGQSRVPQI